MPCDPPRGHVHAIHQRYHALIARSVACLTLGGDGRLSSAYPPILSVNTDIPGPTLRAITGREQMQQPGCSAPLHSRTSSASAMSVRSTTAVISVRASGPLDLSNPTLPERAGTSRSCHLQT